MANPPMSDDNKKRIAAMSFKKGTEAMAKQNWGFCIEMFRQATNLVPENLLYRQSLRGSTERQYNNNGTGASMAGMRLMTTKTSIKKSKMQKDWNSVINTAEDGLAVNPWDATLNAELGEALREVGFEEVAIYCYDRAVKQEATNKDYLRSLARLYESRGNWDQAIGCYEKLMQLDKLDGEARQKITQLQAQKTMTKGGYENAENTNSMRRGTQGQDADGPGQSAEADLQRLIRKEPNNRDHYLKLGDYYRREGKHEKAEGMYEKALELSNGDNRIRETLEDIQLDRFKNALEKAKDLKNKNPDDEDAALTYKKLRGELLQKELEVYTIREQNYPADMRLKYELASRHMDAKQHKLAIPLLQKARGDKRLQSDALLKLGKCFITERQYPLAKRQFEAALVEIDADEKPDVYKEINYLAGRVAEELKEREAAIKYYQAVLEVDYLYKDNRERLQALEGGTSESTNEISH